MKKPLQFILLLVLVVQRTCLSTKSLRCCVSKDRSKDRRARKARASEAQKMEANEPKRMKAAIDDEPEVVMKASTDIDEATLEPEEEFLASMGVKPKLPSRTGVNLEQEPTKESEQGVLSPVVSPGYQGDSETEDSLPRTFTETGAMPK